jgi:hypothetical protein
LALANYIRLHHGTDWQSAQSIAAFGLDASLAAQYNGTGEFWATTDEIIASWFAKVNPAGGPPAMLKFEISEAVITDLLSQGPALLIVHSSTAYEFLPSSFSALNLHMVNKRVIYLP